MNVRGEIYSFSQSKAQRFIANHLDKFAWACIFIAITLAVVSQGYLSPYGIIVSILLCAIPYFYRRVQRNFAYKINLDFESHKVQLYIYKSEAIITVDFGDIKGIRVNGYIIFVLEDKKIFYNDLQNNELLSCLNKIKRIEWGPLCRLWGPSKNVREEITRSTGHP